MKLSPLFSYINTSSFIHKIPVVVKMLVMFFLSVVAFFLPWKIALLGFLISLALSLVAKIRFREIISDLRPAFFYALILYAVNITLAFIKLKKTDLFLWKKIIECFIPSPDFLPLFFRMAMSLSLTSLFFRTSGTASLSISLSRIESKITKKSSTPFADIISLTLAFIPRLALIWENLSLAWSARNGKKGIRKLFILLPLLFRKSMAEAEEKTMARLNRT